MVRLDAVVKEVFAQSDRSVGGVAVGERARRRRFVVSALTVAVATVLGAVATQHVALFALPLAVAAARDAVDAHAMVGARAVVVREVDVVWAMHAACGTVERRPRGQRAPKGVAAEVYGDGTPLRLAKEGGEESVEPVVL